MSSPDVVILDYGSGNLRSAFRALERAGARVELSSDPERAVRATGLVVPGVGAYAACMAGLRAVGGVDAIAERVRRELPILGICVGHQVLFEAGIEHGVRTPGCGVLPGLVEQVVADRLPHMGWNEVESPAGSDIFRGVERDRFYFVHSYAVRNFPQQTPAEVTWCRHESDHFVAAVQARAVTSTQFHPEKSGAAGLRLLKNWISDLP